MITSQPADQSPAIEPLALRPDNAAHAIGISPRKMRQLLGQGRILSIKHGNTRLVPIGALHQFLTDLMKPTA
jgi:excisionase family DNA binding protein